MLVLADPLLTSCSSFVILSLRIGFNMKAEFYKGFLAIFTSGDPGALFLAEEVSRTLSFFLRAAETGYSGLESLKVNPLGLTFTSRG